ncbi:uncharacterized protein LOC113328696 [Papaver somniferum]|uniref:uncharacterized protein LOC113328696 n=1 Tax=Papaver somniferum TaxID=3469 RepID=UPI000E6FB969|nr:uncharacterized protein LOC113328696 [Papaver somniferum]
MGGEIESSTKGKSIEYDMQKKNPVYHLGSSDGPGIIITLIVLKGTNYDEWDRAIRRSLISKRKFGFVDETITEPEDCDQLEEWIAVQSMLVSWISNTLEPSIRSSLGDYDNANLLWTHLKRRFCVVSGTRICQLQASLSECKQKNKEGVAVYFGRLNKIWDELVTYMKVPQCKCGKCACNIASQVSTLREEDFLHYFLIGLDSLYISLREQLLARDPLPSIDVSYQTMVNSERLRIGDVAMSTEVQDNVMTFRVQSDQRQINNTYDPTKYCKHCSREGHSDEGCFQLIGYSEWWGDRSRGGRGYGRGGRAGGRGRAGFTNSRGGRGQGTVNQVRAHNLNISETKQSGGACSSDGSGLTGVTTTQLQQVLEFLNTRKSTSQLQGKKKKTVWIVDTGDTNHVTCKRDDMIDVKDIRACTVGLPDGKYAYSEKIGTVILPGGLRLDNVLYVPQITCNLISVTQLIHELWKFIRAVASTNGTSIRESVTKVARTNGIVFETSCVGTPQQNGRVERKHQHIMNVPPYNQLKVFGCLCYVHDQSSKEDKFASRGRRCVFLGYPFGKKAWKIYDLDARKFLVSRDVKFCEYQFPYRTDLNGTLTETGQLGSDPSTEKNQSNSGGSIETGIGDSTEIDSTADNETDIPGVLTGTDQSSPGVCWSDDENNIVANEGEVAEQGETPEQPEEDVGPSNDVTAEEEMGKGKRQNVPSSRLKGFVKHTIRENIPSHPHSTQSSSSSTPYPLTYYVSCDRFSAVHKKYLPALTAGSEPRKFKEAMKHPGWRKSMEEEIRALEEQGTWELQEFPPGKKALGSKWIYTEKYDANGELVRLKSRLVIFGNHQVEGLDYKETFAPVAKMTTAPRCWFAKLSTALKNYGFRQSYSDYSLFTMIKGKMQLNVLVYVDDLIVAGNNLVEINKFKTYLGQCFKMKDLGKLKYFLGLEIARSKQG